MDILIDANVLIDYVDGRPYAIGFFRRAMKKELGLKILFDVYAEAERVTNSSKRLEKLSAELNHRGLLAMASPKQSERAAAQKIKEDSRKAIGRDIGRVDRLIIAVALARKLVIATRDKDLISLGKSLGAKFVW